MAFLNDGHSTTYEFSVAPSVLFREKEVTPPGIDGGGPNDTTTMRNVEWRTRQPKALKTLTESAVTVSYDPAVYDDILAMINVNQLITLTFSDGSTLAFWGWFNNFTPGACVEGEQPTADCTVVPSNQDSNSDEVAPVYAAAP